MALVAGFDLLIISSDGDGLDVKVFYGKNDNVLRKGAFVGHLSFQHQNRRQVSDSEAQPDSSELLVRGECSRIVRFPNETKANAMQSCLPFCLLASISIPILLVVQASNQPIKQQLFDFYRHDLLITLMKIIKFNFKPKGDERR